jgi:hypothetical protein
MGSHLQGSLEFVEWLAEQCNWGSHEMLMVHGRLSTEGWEPDW